MMCKHNSVSKKNEYPFVTRQIRIILRLIRNTLLLRTVTHFGYGYKSRDRDVPDIDIRNLHMHIHWPHTVSHTADC